MSTAAGRGKVRSRKKRETSFSVTGNDDGGGGGGGGDSGFSILMVSYRGNFFNGRGGRRIVGVLFKLVVVDIAI